MLFVATISYNNPKVIKESIDHYYEMCSVEPDYHFILNNHYPLHKEELKETFNYFETKYRCKVFDAGSNIGMIGGLDYLLNELYKKTTTKDNDFGIFYDSNAYVVSKNFDKALLDVAKDSKFAGSVLTSKNKNYDNLPQLSSSNYNYYESINGKDKNSVICLSKKNYLKYKNYYFSFSDSYIDFTNAESLKNALKENNVTLAYLSDYKENVEYFTLKEDHQYLNYKNTLILLKTKNNISFEDYLKNYDSFVKINFNVLENISAFSGTLKNGF